MGNTITLKHGEIVPTTNNLTPFELGYCTKDGALYINNGSQIKSIFQSNGAISTVLSNNLTASKVLISNTDGKIAVSDITSSELNFLDGVTSNIQNQLNNVQTQLTNYYNATTSRTKNTVLAAPNGTDGAAVFRELVANDLPIIPVAKGGTGATDATTARSNLDAAPTIHNHKNDSLNLACVEFTGTTGHGGYIDFHYGGSTADYTSRIIESSSGVVTLNDSPIITPAAPNGFYYLGIKASLPSGANFNTYITPGQWATNTYAIASTFSNCPYITAGSLTVYYSDTTTNEIHQIWESRDYKVYERYSNNGGSTWSAWNKRLTSANVVGIYNASVTFSNGVATYTHSAITANSVVIVQRRSGSAGNNQQFNVHSNAGSVTICTTSTISVALNLNIIIINN